MNKISLLLSAMCLMPLACKQRVSDVKGIDAGVADVLDLSSVTDPQVLKDICSQEAVVLFIGDAEKLGKIIVNPTATEPFPAEQLNLIERNDAAKEAWYFGKVKQEYEALRQKLSNADSACGRVGVEQKVTLLAILDGPGVGDSSVEISQFSAEKSPGTSSKNPQSMFYDVKTHKLTTNDAKKNFELLLARDIADVITAFRTSNLGKEFYGFAVKIIKGHGVRVGDSGIYDLNEMLRPRHMSTDASSSPTITVLDSQDENGFIGRDSNAAVYRIPMWSPETLCGRMYGSNPACMRDTLARLSKGFAPSTMVGCAGSRFGGLTNQGIEKQGIEKQGTEKQGTEKQGAEKQGTEKQGIEKQGIEKQGAGLFLQDLSGIDYGPNSHQGGKGLAMEPRETFPPKFDEGALQPAAYRVIGAAKSLASTGTQGQTLSLPIAAAHELAIFDSCSINMDSVHPDEWYSPPSGQPRPEVLPPQWVPERHPKSDVVVLHNPLPLSADAVEYGTLNLQQYYLLTSLILGSADQQAKKRLGNAMGGFLGSSSGIERSGKVAMRLYTAQDRGFRDPEDFYCSLYAKSFGCFHDQYGYYGCDGLGNKRSGLLDSELLDIERGEKGIESRGLLDAVLTELRNDRPLTKPLLDQVSNICDFERSGAFMRTFVPGATLGVKGDCEAYNLDLDLTNLSTPLAKKLLLQHFEVLKQLNEAYSFSVIAGFDPMRVNLTTVALNDLRTAESKKTSDEMNTFFRDLDYKTMHATALAQGATKETLASYQKRYERHVRTISDFSNRNSSARTPYLIQAVLDATSGTD